MSYSSVRDHEFKTPCVIWDFPSLSTRFVTVSHSGLSLPGGYVQFVGAIAAEDSGSKLSVDDNTLTIGTSSFTIVDASQSIIAWVSAHDNALCNCPVIRREGFVGVAEAEYISTRWLVSDYGISDRAGGTFEFKLDNALKKLSNSLYEWIDGERYGLKPTDDSTPSTLNSNAMTITLDKPPQDWRAPGYLLLYGKQHDRHELVSYSAVNTTTGDITVTQRRAFGVGYLKPDPTHANNRTAIAFSSDHTDVYQVWVKRGSPITVLLQLLLTSDTVGKNGSYDLGTGDGLDMDPALVDITGMETLRDASWPDPTYYADGSKNTGTAVLFVEKEPLDDVLKWASEAILTPFALVPGIDSLERFTLRQMNDPDPAAHVVGTEYDTASFSASKWSRNYPSRVNNLLLQSDFSPMKSDPGKSTPKTNATSVTRYGKAKAREVRSRGGRSAIAGFPELGAAADLDTAGGRILAELANPYSEIDVDAFWKHKDIGIGDSIQLSVRNLPDLANGRRGVVNGIFMVNQKSVDRSKGRVRLRVRLRRSVS